MVGKIFGRLTVLIFTKRRKGRTFWQCQCECGIIKEIDGYALRSGTTSSCGCFKIDLCTKHGMHRTKVYQCWSSMLTRCTNELYKGFHNYGGRCISIEDPRWFIFENFYADMGESPNGMTLERKDTNKGYFKDNCCWATMTEQANNRRNNRLLTYYGETQTLSQWSRRLGIHKETLKGRLNKGWDVELALTTPVRKRTKKGA